MLKKIAVIFTVIACLCGCAGDEPQEREKKKKPKATYEVIWDTAEYEYDDKEYAWPSIEMEEDMDCDGEDETVTLEMEGEKYDYCNAELCIGDEDIDVFGDTWVYGVTKVGIADIDPEDDAKEIMIFAYSDNDWSTMQVFRYEDEEIERIMCKNTYDDENEITDGIALGYSSDNLEMNDDGSFVVEETTNTLGMWRVYVTYEINEDGYLEMIKQDEYEVVEGSGYSDEGEDGYCIVNEDYETEDFELEEGDRIKVIKDDQEGNVLIQKKDGEEGWINIGARGKSNNGESLADGKVSRLFMMAG